MVQLTTLKQRYISFMMPGSKGGLVDLYLAYERVHHLVYMLVLRLLLYVVNVCYMTERKFKHLMYNGSYSG